MSDDENYEKLADEIEFELYKLEKQRELTLTNQAMLVASQPSRALGVELAASGGQG